MRGFAPSQPEDSCTYIARQCVLILLMLTVELLSKLLSVSVAQNIVINVLAHLCSAPEPEACPLSMGIIRERHIHLTHTGAQQDVAEQLPQNILTLFLVCTCAQYLFMSELVDGCGSPASLSRHATHSLLDASRYTQKNADTHENAGLTTRKVQMR